MRRLLLIYNVFLIIIHLSYIIIRDPDPFEIFTFQFSTNNNKDNDETKIIDIQIRGYKTDADEVWQSTGLTLWKASDYLCQYQMDNIQLFENKRILELGAGLGLNGILAWRSTISTKSQVCITDGDSDALVHLRENVNRNHRNTMVSSHDDTDDISNKVSCHQLIWGKQTSEKFLSNIANNQTYDVIIASDIIYSPVIVEPLWETVQTLLKKPSNVEEEGEEDGGGIFVMAYARRKVPVSIDLVCEKAEEHGFVWEMVKEDEEEGIWVYTFRFKL